MNSAHLNPTRVRFGCFAEALAVVCCCLGAPAGAAEHPSVSGIYPHLAYFNNEGECGTGAVVPWADRLWVITYGPHFPKGSSDKLYEIDGQLRAVIRPESVGGTPANRMIHRESEQLFIGPYAIDKHRNVRVIPPAVMPGRLTAAVRHLSDPATRIYYATMEEGFYEADVRTLAVKELYRDANSDAGSHAGSLLPGYHGKGAYSGQRVLVYANNGEYSPEAMRRPEIASGCLAEWNGTEWRVVRRNQFTDVTGPGGIFGANDPEHDPIWSIGWDHRSLILMVRDAGQWHAYRLPKASHCYDGAHGWNTEWPRIRDIGTASKSDLLMTMHGMFWRFPKAFSFANSAGIGPRSTYLKVIGDFCRWEDRIVFGCDDTAKSEFLNKRKAKGDIAGPGQSQSNLWFVDPRHVDELGAPLGRGGVWLDEPVNANEPSEPFLFSGFERRGVHLTHDTGESVTFTFEVDANGNGRWHTLRSIRVGARGYAWTEFKPGERGAWIRVRTDRDCGKATAFFNFSNADRRSERADAKFDGLARTSVETQSGGLIRARGDNKRTLSFAAIRADGGTASDAGYYELDGSMTLRRIDDPQTHAWVKQNVKVPRGVLTIDDASVLYVDDAGRRWRLPKGDAAFDQPGPLGDERIDREVVTERDLFNAHGTFYELPAENAGGFAKIRPITTHNRRIQDYCSYRGMLVMTGLSDSAPRKSPRIVRSDDGKAALWTGVVDDLWQLGKARGKGGPWNRTAVKRNVTSDPYLMSGYDRKWVQLTHDSTAAVRFRIEIDITGTGLWREYEAIEVPSGRAATHRFPDGLQAYWFRMISERDCSATATFTYE